MARVRYSPFLVLLLLLLQACNPEVEVYAPEKELYVVYGVLNPDNDEQFVSVTKVYQTESDALFYAANNDLTARNFNVTIQSDTSTWVGQLFDSPQDSNAIFAKTSGIYRFSTAGNQALKTGTVYDLRITKPDDNDFLIHSQTKIPERPRLSYPIAPIHLFQQSLYTLPTLDFEEDQLISFDMGGGFGFELRIFVAYKDGNEDKIGKWGPTRLFIEPQSCASNVELRKMCYKIPEFSVPRILLNKLESENGAITFDDSIKTAPTLEGLSRNVWIEVTAIDSAMTDFLYANDPFGYGLDLLMDRKEISNISGQNLGLFGSFSTHSRYFFFSGCTLYLAGLSNNKPVGCGD